jgi:hypothetical protein
MKTVDNLTNSIHEVVLGMAKVKTKYNYIFGKELFDDIKYFDIFMTPDERTALSEDHVDKAFKEGEIVKQRMLDILKTIR